MRLRADINTWDVEKIPLLIEEMKLHKVGTKEICKILDVKTSPNNEQFVVLRVINLLSLDYPIFDAGHGWQMLTPALLEQWEDEHRNKTYLEMANG